MLIALIGVYPHSSGSAFRGPCFGASSSLARIGDAYPHHLIPQTNKPRDQSGACSIHRVGAYAAFATSSFFALPLFTIMRMASSKLT